METTNPVVPALDIADYIGRRQSTFTFALTNALTGEILGDVQPDSDSAPTITHDTSRTIMRTLDNVVLERVDTAAINPITDRITVAMIVNGVTYPLGRYMFSDTAYVEASAGEWSNVQLFDEMFIVDQQIERGIGYTRTHDVNAEVVMRDVMLGMPVRYRIDPSSYPVVGAWASGTNRGQVISAIALQGDYFNPWFANDGDMHMIRAFDPALAVPSFDWDATDHVVADGVVRHSDLLQAPNRFVVVANGGTDLTTPITASYDTPPTAPHSIAARGFVIPDVVSMQLDTVAQATATARNLGLRQTIFERLEVVTVPDPRHDGYDVIKWDGDLWLELAWNLPLFDGSDMRHILRKAYR